MNKANPLLTPQRPFVAQGLRLGNRKQVSIYLYEQKISRDSNYISIYFYLKSHDSNYISIKRDSNYIGSGTIHRKGHEDDEAENAE